MLAEILCDLTEKETRLKIANDLMRRKQKDGMYVSDDVLRIVLGGVKYETEKNDA